MNNEETIVDLFDHQADRVPDQIAMVCAGEAITYKELDEQANQLARYLQGMGVGPEVLVGMCVQRSIKTMIIMLGILKAGGAFIAIDPDSPNHRIRLMIEETKASIIVTDKGFKEFFGPGVNIIDLDTDWKYICSQGRQPPESHVRSQNLAYIMFTSGSTGVPKGILMTHETLVSRFHRTQQVYKFNSKDRFQQIASLSFDMALWEFFMPVFVGGVIVIANSRQTGDLDYLVEFIKNQAITIARFVPPVLQLLLDRGKFAACTSVRRVITGGDKMSLKLLTDFIEGTGAELYNQYGPSERPTCLTWKCEKREGLKSVPIGRPFPGTGIYILDEKLEPVPMGTVGELYVGGRGLARGYRERPGRTAANFIPNPYDPIPGSRFYRTGDLVRLMPGGDLEFIGRKDFQVKIRAVRIEPGEIEHHLLNHPSVKEAVVAAKEIKGNNELVAYMISDEPLDSREIRTYLAGILPGPMIPAYFVQLEQFPLSANDKIDRKALPNPGGTDLASNPAGVSPRNQMEADLLEIWQEVLDRKAMGVFDNFFEFGGHSLNAIKIIWQIQEKLEIAVNLNDIFTAPTTAGLAQILKSRVPRDSIRLNPIPKQEYYDIAPAQKRLWITCRMNPGSSFYNSGKLFLIEGKLQVHTLRRTVRTIVERHESLRTFFVTSAGEVKQKFYEKHEKVNGIWEEIDVSREPCPGEAAREYAKREFKAPFDLSKGPLLRIRLLKIEENKYLFVFSIHHIITDGWSIDLFMKELNFLYSAFTHGKSNHLPHLPIQYRDYAVWHTRVLSGASINRHRDYWLKKLGGELLPLDLPTDYPRPPVQTHNGDFIRFRFHHKLTTALRRLGEKYNVSLFTCLITLLKILIHRYTNQEDIIVGTVSSGRTKPGLEKLMGFFVNTLALRDEVKADEDFTVLLEKVRNTLNEAYEHEIYPFDRVVDDLDMVGDTSRSSLLDVAVTFEVTSRDKPVLDDLEIQNTLEGLSDTAVFALVFYIKDMQDEVLTTVTYNTDLYKEDRIRRLCGHFTELARDVVEYPQRPIRDLSLLTKSEREQVVRGFNDTSNAYPTTKTIVDLFEARVEENPDATALVFEDKHLSYSRLNSRAEQLAGYLWELGVRPEVLVGMCIKRSLDMVAGIIGILKAGGAYVPLEPNYPEERLAFMIEDSGINIILTQKNLSPKFPSLITLNLDTSLTGLPTPHSSPAAILNPGNLAYVIYTSGSTGKPKGVCVSHRSVVRLVKGVNYASLTSNEIFFQFVPISFDVSTFEIWAALLNGAKLVVMTAHTPTLQELAQVITSRCISTLWLTTGLFHTMVDEQLDYLRQVPLILTGGDVISVPHVRKVLQALEKGILINLYGPSENTTFTSYYPVENNIEFETSVPVGYPVSNTRVYILDRHLHPVPVGITGELYTGGDGVARCYHNRPGLTAERFIPNPFGEPGTRLYKTGDLARFLADGNIEFLGRIDNQVKISGFRIELGEIETRLQAHENIKEAAVLVREDAAGDKYLCAFVAPLSPSQPPVLAAQLKEYLNECLPVYMVPTSFIPVEKLPLTANSKIDRKALSRLPDGGSQEAEKSSDVTPRSEIEKKLLNIWREILGKEKIGIKDDFFDSGGNSLKAIRAISRIYKDLSVEIDLHDIFEAPTAAEMAERLKQKELTEYTDIQQVEEKEYYDTANAQRRLWVLNQFEEESISYNVPSVFTAVGELDISAMNKAFQHLIDRHASLRTSFAAINGAPRQIIHKKVVFAPEIVRCEEADPQKQKEFGERIIKEHAETVFDLSAAPLFKVKILKFSRDQGRQLLLVNMHHIITDGWSMNIFFKELGDFYNYFAAREPGVQGTGEREPTGLSAPLPIQYKDYTAWQNALLSSASALREKEYWHKKLSGSIPVLDFPGDFPRPAVKTNNGSKIYYVLDKEVTAGINRVGKELGVTLFMILSAAVKVLIYRFTGQEDIITGSPLAGRNHPDLEKQVGFYVNTLAFRDTVKGEDSVGSLLQQMKRTAARAYANQTYPFDKLVDELNPERDTSRNPLFDVMVALLDNGWGQLKFDNLEITRVESNYHTSKFDLSFYFAEEDAEISMGIEYNTDIFKKERIERLCIHFCQLVKSIAADVRQAVRDLNIITEEEKHRLLVKFNDTTVDYPRGKTLAHLFAEQVEKNPHHTAVVYENSQLSYNELNQRANFLAVRLRGEGISRGRITAIMVERSLEMIIGLMGILNAGGAYLPISPAYPRARINYILKDSGTRVLLTQKKSEEKIENEYKIIYLDDPYLYRGNTSQLENQTRSNHLAYVIYTSGSTGNPKGVIIEHGSIVNLLWGLHHLYPLTGFAVYLLKTSYLFDVSVSELFGWFVGRGRLGLLKEGAEKDPGEIITAIEYLGVTHINFVPSQFNVFVDGLNPQNIKRISGLKYILLAGETLLPELVDKYRALDCNIQLENLYGPTEAAVYASTYSLAQWNGNSSIPIGKPFGNTRLYVMDRDGGLQPIGVPGELCIAGIGAARGYLNNPELTAEKFCLRRPGEALFEKTAPPGPPRKNFSLKVPGKGNYMSYRSNTSYIFYHTGDLARWLPDGNIEFLGRLDYQVKIRGFRIELLEIENQLLNHQGVKEAAVTIKSDKTGDTFLCAYIVPYSPGELDLSQLRYYLQQKLPDYMIPAYFVTLDQMPLTAAGKVDRKSLPQPGISSTRKYAAPGNESEKMLRDIWSRVLGVDKQGIGINDNFFELGGQSLKAITLVSGIHKAFNVNLSLAKFFAMPSIKKLSQFIKNTVREQYIAGKPAEDREYYALSSAQKRLYVIRQLDPDSTAYNMPIVVRLEGTLEKEKIENIFRKLTDRHESFRTSFEIVNRQPVQKIHKQVELKIEYYSLEPPGGDPADIIRRFVRPFDLSQAAHIRVGLIKTRQNEHILMVDTHHITSDGNSHELLMKDFLALNRGETLPELKLRYRDFSQWQNSRIISGEIKKQEEFWLKELEGKIPVLKMPVDYNRSEIKSNKGDKVYLRIAPDEAEYLRELAKKEETTMFMVLLALFNIFLYKICRQEDIVIGTIITGRQHPDVENIIGMFVNTIALRNYPRGDKIFIEFLREVRERTLDAFDNQEYQFDDLVKKVAQEREAGRNPLFDVLFSFSSSAPNSSHPGADRAGEPVEPGLKIKPYEWQKDAPAKFDMLFTGTDAVNNPYFVLEYKTELFKKQTIERFVKYFKEIVPAVKGNESIRLKNIKISHELVTVTPGLYQQDESEFEF